MRGGREIGLLVADPHPIVRAGVTALFSNEPDIDVLGQTGDGGEVPRLYARLRPDVLLLGLEFAGANGIDVISAVLAADRRARILVLTVRDGDHDISQALRAGARGYLLKDARPDDLITAVRTVAAGRTVIPPFVAARLAEHHGSEPLTRRELEVLRGLAAGKANKEIAFDLAVSEGTAKTHVARILHKLGCGSRAHAVAVAARRGLLRL